MLRTFDGCRLLGYLIESSCFPWRLGHPSVNTAGNHLIGSSHLLTFPTTSGALRLHLIYSRYHKEFRMLTQAEYGHGLLPWDLSYGIEFISTTGFSFTFVNLYPSFLQFLQRTRSIWAYANGPLPYGWICLKTMVDQHPMIVRLFGYHKPVLWS